VTGEKKATRGPDYILNVEKETTRKIREQWRLNKSLSLEHPGQKVRLQSGSGAHCVLFNFCLRVMPSIVHVQCLPCTDNPMSRVPTNLKSEIVSSFPQAEPGRHLLTQLVESLFQSLNGRMRCCTPHKTDRPQLASISWHASFAYLLWSKLMFSLA